MATRTRTATSLRMLSLVMALGSPGLAGCSAGETYEVQPADQPAGPADAIASADQLLTRLETADRDLRTLTAEVIYDKTFALVGDQQTRIGRLYYEGSSEAEKDTPTRGRKFAIHFDQLIVGGRASDEPQIYIFDGQTLLEKYPATRTFKKRPIVRPGEKFDPLKIGEGPLPIPIGQKREDILARYDATLLPATDGLDPVRDKDLHAFVAGSQQLRLVPRTERKREDKFAEIRLWYRADSEGGGRLLPRMARTVAASEPGEEGDQSLVRLINVKVNADMPRDVIDMSIPAGWDGQVEEFREPR